MTLNCSKRNIKEIRNFKQLCQGLSDMDMQNQFNKISVFECQTISGRIQGLLYKSQDIQVLGFLFSNSRTFKDFQVLYEPWCRAFAHDVTAAMLMFQFKIIFFCLEHQHGRHGFCMLSWSLGNECKRSIFKLYSMSLPRSLNT